MSGLSRVQEERLMSVFWDNLKWSECIFALCSFVLLVFLASFSVQQRHNEFLLLIAILIKRKSLLTGC